jgi:hypothetical protein
MRGNQNSGSTLRWLLVLAVPALAVLRAEAQVQFGAPTSYSVGTTPVATVAGDFNEDGKLDLATANYATGDVSVLLGNGDGTFQPAVSYPAGLTPTFMAEGDFNGDGKLDLAVSNGTSNTVSILLGNGDGTFQSPVQYNVGNNANYIAVGDFNNDKKPDLYVSDGNTVALESPGPLNISILFGNGDGTFQSPVETSVNPAVVAPGRPPYINEMVALGDFNRDGFLDVAISYFFGNPASGVFGGYLIILLGNGDGTFQPPATYYPFGPFDYAYATWGVVAGDFNGDGQIDLAASGGTGVWVWSGRGDGTFSFVPSPAGGYDGYGNSFDAAAVADLNNDGKLDLLALNIDLPADGSLTLQWGLGNGDGTFQGLPGNDYGCTPVSNCMPLPASFALADLFSPPVLVDLNGDKLPDVVLTHGSANSVDVLLNTSGAPSFSLNLTMAGVVLGTAGGFVASQPLGLVCEISCVGTFPTGTTVTLTETPLYGSVFAGWSGACSGMGATCTVTMNAAQSVAATFNSLLSVALAGNGSGTVTSNPAGINCGNTCSAGFPVGTFVALTATPDSNSNFSGWSGVCSGSACNITMTGNQSVTATFSAQDFSLAPGSTTLTMQPGAQGTDVLTLAGLNGPFASAIQLTCSVAGPAPMPTCALSPTSVTPGANSVTSTLTVTVPAAGAQLRPDGSQFGKFVYATWLPLIFGIIIVERSKKHRPDRWILGGGALLLLLLQIACGGSSSNAVPPTNYTVTVTGTSGALQHTAQVSVTVQ